jgi:hypothetical protein
MTRRLRRRATARRSLVVALLIGAALGPGALARRPPNVIGTLTRPGLPACRGDEPCDLPAIATVLRFERHGRLGAKVLASTRFRLRLAPGRYSISARQPAAPARAARVGEAHAAGVAARVAGRAGGAARVAGRAGGAARVAGRAGGAARVRPSTVRVPRHGIVRPHLTLVVGG